MAVVFFDRANRMRASNCKIKKEKKNSQKEEEKNDRFDRSRATAMFQSAVNIAYAELFVSDSHSWSDLSVALMLSSDLNFFVSLWHTFLHVLFLRVSRSTSTHIATLRLALTTI